jgi:hypothetical protein
MRRTWLVFGLVGLSLMLGQGANARFLGEIGLGSKDKTAKNKANAENYCRQKVADGTYAECFADADRLCNMKSGFTNVAKFDEGGNSYWACCKTKSGGGVIGAVTGAVTGAVSGVSGAVSGAWNKKCSASYVYGTYKSQEYDLGKVDGLNKKSECLARARSRMDLASAALKAAVPNLAGASNCGSMVDVYVDTTVEGKKFSKDGSVQVQLGKPPKVETKAAKVTCSRGWVEGNGCVDQVANPVNGGIPTSLKWKYVADSGETVFVDDRGGIRMKFKGSLSCDSGYSQNPRLGGCFKTVGSCSW